jgi:16S rRNA processing protein RimM
MGLWVMAQPPVRVTLAEVAPNTNGVLTLRFEGRSSVESVESWRGCCLAVEESERAPLAGDCFYHDELRGMAVETEGGSPVGTIRDVWSNGPHDLLVLDCEDGERLLPMIRAFVVQVDRERRRIAVRPPNGWLDDVAV